jgi:hypothetical protein
MTGWTTPADLQRRLRRRWDSGDLLRQWGRGAPWEPISFGIRGPTPGEIAADLGAAQQWTATWDRAADLRLERRQIGGRLIGTNELPAKAWIDDYAQAWAVLGVASLAARFGEILAETRRRAPQLVDWALAHPLRSLDLASAWPALVDAVLWIDQRADQPVYLRQIDVPGVDTKFIECHRAVLADLLDLQLPPARINASTPRSSFEARYRFRSKPVYLRMRSLDPAKPLAGGYEELAVRCAELAGRPPAHSGVYIVENEITYLAFPPVPDAIALLGGGYAVSAIQPLRWLGDVRLFYWGDIDTHGFAILDRLRQHFPHARSLLMDRATLLAHEGQWVREPKPVATRLERLHPDEAGLYRDLVEDNFGPSVRLEQERVSYGAVERAVGHAGASA